MMQLIPKAGDLDAQLVHDPWATLRRRSYGRYEPPTPQPAAQVLPAPRSTGREGMWLQIVGLESNPHHCRGWVPVLGQISLNPACPPPKVRTCCFFGGTPGMGCWSKAAALGRCRGE